MIIEATREQWRTIESLAAGCPEVSRFSRDTMRAHGEFRGVSRDPKKSRATMSDHEARAILSAARHAAAAISKRPRYLESPRFILLRDVACILSAALDSCGFVSDCH